MGNAVPAVNFVPGPCRTCSLIFAFTPCGSTADCAANTCDNNTCRLFSILPIPCVTAEDSPSVILVPSLRSDGKNGYNLAGVSYPPTKYRPVIIF